MGKIRKSYIGYLQVICSFFLLISISSCSIPKIIVYDDPLTAEEHNDLGVIYEKKNMYDLAEKEYKKAINKNKNWYLPYFNLGNLYYKKGDLDKSIEYYKKALERENRPDILNNLAYVLYEKGDYTEALKYIEMVLKLDKREEYFDTYYKIKEKVKDLKPSQ
ncbi:MAG: tetratricopeptide repeat protein [Hydrogenothermaceae bacterium]